MIESTQTLALNNKSYFQSPRPFRTLCTVQYWTRWSINRPIGEHSSRQVRCVCLKNETIGVVAFLVVCHCPVTPFLSHFVLNFLHCVCLHVCLCVYVSNRLYITVFLMYQKNFFFVLNDFSSNWLILLYFNSMPLDRNTLPKKGLRYRTHEDADPEFYCISW